MKRIALGLLLALMPQLATAEEVEVELVLLADASGSIDAAEIAFQRQGYAEAITDPSVLAVIEGSAYGKIAVTYVEWAAAGTEDVVVPWMVISDAASARAFAEALLPPPRRAFGRNAIGSALLKGKELIETNAYEGWRKVIDFSGDSANNWNGPSIAEARSEVLAAGITINGLPILCRFCNGRPSGADLERIYAERIIGGPGAFVITADSEASLGDAIRRKLILEIGGWVPADAPARRVAGAD
ncbi:hypothetical protein Dshi_2692 [Dinoroseobacter shibae DFL 12 = DSM 16493]|jgi:hypothetical protein|uniref:VWFA domain-containing protein n=1 Tax=Dinoroseobacter shibae (strain DSM 16493 / NCIMB 14021 / DFL 12) TaxID=398580 RepID=A8LII4_DINSH|nr:DUF1194 domain-containing protein [Dinoroseobacter shibae]ABV94425.1 hypothetical protein Dshi_2692 [Dinoroseobacter shibae DFL 12 = DSM 16493]URF45852.1 DUF1194 domain-containing protein [Dinoroseobacter shibae]URF50159.1 DUF1194 domain-containing protein [Dinoroseobacter shibae]